MTVLIIVESPAKCKKIESFLGNKVKCLASFGHINKLNDLNDIDKTNNYKPKWTKLQNQATKQLSYDIKNADDVYIATDDDREGEAIGYHICKTFKLPMTTKRIKFSEITKSAVEKAYHNPTKLDMDLVNAAIGRQVLDLIVGFTISPFLWRHIHNKKGLSAGRCQTPALRLVYENHLLYQDKPGDQVYKITGYFLNKHVPFTLNKDMVNPNNFLDESSYFSHQITDIVEKESTKPAPKPLSTSRLQQMANSKLGYSPKMTMDLCQKLYENGFITYMRTDSQTYSEEFIELAKDYIHSKWTNKFFTSHSDTLIHKDQKAHEAIRPTNIECEQCNLNDKRLASMYKLIRNTTLESLMKDAVFSDITVKISAPQSLYYSATASTPTFLGWLVLSYNEKDNLYQYFKLLTKKYVKAEKITAKVHLKNATLHLTEANLVNKLEKKGIGRPSTFSSLVEKIKSKGYVKVETIKGKDIDVIEYELKDGEITEIEMKKTIGEEKNKLNIQPLGIMVIEYLIDNFRTLFEYGYTEQMETNLDKITNGTLKWQQLCKDCDEVIDRHKKQLKDEKIQFKLDDYHTYMIGKWGPTIKYVNGDIVIFKKVRSDIDYEKIKSGLLKVDDIVDKISNESIGMYRDHPINKKKGPYGYYIEWNNVRKSLNKETNITLDDAIKLLEAPAKFYLALDENLSIREGKYGKYIYYKTKSMKKPSFYKLNGYKDKDKISESFNQEEILILKNWIKEKYKI